MTCGTSVSEYTHRTRSTCMHMTVIRMWLSLQATEWHKKYKHVHNSRIVSSVKKFSMVYIVCCTLAAHHVLCRTHARHDAAYTEMAWTDGALSLSFSTCANPHSLVTST